MATDIQELQNQLDNVLDELFEKDATYDMHQNAKKNLKIVYRGKFLTLFTSYAEKREKEAYKSGYIRGGIDKLRGKTRKEQLDEK